MWQDSLLNYWSACLSACLHFFLKFERGQGNPMKANQPVGYLLVYWVFQQSSRPRKISEGKSHSRITTLKREWDLFLYKCWWYYCIHYVLTPCKGGKDEWWICLPRFTLDTNAVAMEATTLGAILENETGILQSLVDGDYRHHSMPKRM